jgi:hypothetical protein
MKKIAKTKNLNFFHSRGFPSYCTFKYQYNLSSLSRIIIYTRCKGWDSRELGLKVDSPGFEMEGGEGDSRDRNRRE